MKSCRILVLLSLALAAASSAAGGGIRPPELPQAGLTLALAPGGNDAHDGSPERPFATLEGARDAIRSLKMRGPLPAGGVVVAIADGTYPLGRTFKLTAEDSGTAQAPVVYQGRPGARCRFSGDVELTGFAKLTDPALLARLPAEARGKVWQVGLKAAGIDSVPPPRLGGFASGRGFRTTPAVRLFAGERELPLARWPNHGASAIAKLLAPVDQTIHGMKGSKTGRFTCKSDRLARWTADPDIILHGWWFWDWAESRELVESIDLQSGAITLAPPFHTYGYRAGQPFHATNLFSEIDRPGEWYLDRTTLTLYVHEMSGSPAGLRLSLADFPAMTMENVEHVRFQGIAWTGGAADGIRLSNCRNAVIEGCRFSRLGGDAIVIDGGSACGVVSCDINLAGRGGVVLGGGQRKSLTPGRHYVTNCHFHHLSRIDTTYTPAILVTGVGHVIAHNRIHDLPSSAIRVGGNDHVIEFNDVSRVVLESDDQGAVDMWGDPTLRGNVFRFNRWTDIGRNADGSQPKHGRAAIRFDDAISGQLVETNIFVRCGGGGAGFGAVQIHGGRDQVIRHNLFWECPAAVSFSPWQLDRWRAFVAPKFPTPELDRDLYLARYPELADLAAEANANMVAGNLAVNCKTVLLRPPPNTTGHGNLVEAATAPAGPVPDDAIRRAGIDPEKIRSAGLYQTQWRPSEM
jgi:hypothetical protein